MHWPFDQAKNVAAITSRFVLEERFPVLRVVHYSDDHSWAFECGTTNSSDDIRIIGMGEAVALDPTIMEIANLPPGGGPPEKKFVARGLGLRSLGFDVLGQILTK